MMYTNTFMKIVVPSQGGSGRRKRPHPDFDTQSVDITFRVGVTILTCMYTVPTDTGPYACTCTGATFLWGSSFPGFSLAFRQLKSWEGV